MLKGVLFDWDGTLCDTLPICIAAFRGTMETFLGKTLTDAQITEHFGVNEFGIIKIMMPNRPGDWEPALEEYNRRYLELHHLSPRPYDGMVDVMLSLKKKGVIVGLVTGKAPGSCRISLEYTGLKDFFDFVRTGSEKGVCKARCAAEFLEEFSLAPEDVYYVGDARSDVSEARRVGIHSLAVLWSSVVDREGVMQEGPERAFDTVSELDNYFKSIQ